MILYYTSEITLSTDFKFRSVGFIKNLDGWSTNAVVQTMKEEWTDNMVEIKYSLAGWDG